MENDPQENTLRPVQLDIHDMDILSVSVVQHVDGQVSDVEGGGELPMNVGFVQTIKNDGKLLELHLDIPDWEVTEVVTVSVVVQFVSRITSTLQGIYQVDYKDDFGDKAESLISTQFSPIDARRAFPCIDQPDRKAVFEITLVTPKNRTMVLSNMPVATRWV